LRQTHRNRHHFKLLGRTSTPKAALRLKSARKERHQAFDNEGFSSDQDEVLRIETVNDSSPKIKMGSPNIKKIDDSTCTFSDDEDKFMSDSKSRIPRIKVIFIIDS
jgi:hypothetical protein